MRWRSTGDFAEALNNRGATLASLKRHEEALASYGRALALKPGFAEALQNRGARCRILGGTRPPSKDLERALRLNADLPFARGTLAAFADARLRLARHTTQESKRVIADVRAGKRAIEPFMFLAVSDSPGRPAALFADMGARPVPAVGRLRRGPAAATAMTGSDLPMSRRTSATTRWVT